MCLNMDYQLEKMLDEGWTERFAQYFLRQINSEKSSPHYKPEDVEWAHQHGFFASHASYYEKVRSIPENYLSDYVYYKTWPHNPWTRIWVNDKLTLKYLLASTEFGKLMPDYYYYTMQSGIRSLIDCPYHGFKFEEFVNLLREKKHFACKPCNGSRSMGFVKMSYIDDVFYLNGKVVSRDGIQEFLFSHPNYIYTQYIVPAEYLRCYGEKIHTIRLIVLNEKGDNPQIVGGYVRFPMDNNGEANYSVLDTNDIVNYNFFVGIDVQTGQFGKAKKVFENHVEDTDVHPETGAVIKGGVEDYASLAEMVLGIARRFNVLQWFGVDIGATDEGFKCMEINTFPGVAYPQIFTPLMENKDCRQFFMNKMEEIDAMNTKNHLIRKDVKR